MEVDEKILYVPREYHFNIENTNFVLRANIVTPREKYVRPYSHSFCVIIFVTRGNLRLTVVSSH